MTLRTKKLHYYIKKTGGRNNTGRITIRHRGSGHKRIYRPLEYYNQGHSFLLSGIINRIEYDPNRNTYLAECINNDKTFYKLLGGKELIKEKLIGTEIKVVKLKDVGIGEEVYNVSLRSGQTGKIGRASGTRCKIMKQTDKQTVIRLPSHEVKTLSNQNTCIIGGVIEKPKGIIGKAGRNRWKGIRPTVRGFAMNPIDHPNGGKTRGGEPKTPWGKLAKWVPTRKSKQVRV